MRRHFRVRTALLTVLGFFALFGAVTMVLGVRAGVALADAAGRGVELQQQVSNGDVEQATVTLRELQDSAGTARSSTDNIVWSSASRLPFLGGDLAAVGTVSRELDRVSTEALPPIVDIADQVRLETFSPRDGQVDLAAVAAVRESIAEASHVLTRSAEELNAIRTDELVGRLRAPVGEVQAQLSAAARASASADIAGRVLPSMLGAQSPRRYLLLIQNNAEIRSTGGIPGSFAVLKASRGRVEMGFQGSIQDVPPIDQPVVELTEGERSLYPSSLASDLRDTTFTPDFPRAARLASELVSRDLQTEFDGVISIDPVTLGSILQGLGDITLDDGTVLTADNAVNELLGGVYLRYADDPVAQDEAFADAARRIFDEFVSGEGEPALILRALGRAAADNRILVWTRDEDVQEQIVGSGISGTLPFDDRRHVGVYLNDATAAKMQYFLQTEGNLRSVRCLPGDAQQLELRTRLTSTAPPDAAGLPMSITGLGDPVERGVQRVIARVYAPTDSDITSLRVGGEERIVVGGSHGGRPVAVIPVTLGPGESTAIVLEMTTAAGVTTDPVFSSTPGIISSAPNDVRVRSACD